ncbi:hypothetical protein C2S52_001124 [Perilla frutescens var. hirtella]|nr:hypothetical protein C2S51_007351 [Perilla frutescens var. frutescens]KAH6800660.1 hypothetical protein C2S52_001124 [Perilla frutescens var. hirtella]
MLSRDKLIDEIHDFMETSPTSVRYTLSYLTMSLTLKTDVDLTRLVQKQDEPIVYVTEKSIQQTPIVMSSNDNNDDPIGDNSLDDLSYDDDDQSEVHRNQIAEFCEWIREPGRLHEFVNILSSMVGLITSHPRMLLLMLKLQM